MSESTQLIEALSTGEIEAIEAAAAHVPHRQSAAIEALQIVQEHRGWISNESLAAIARQLQMSAAELDSIATFYNLIFRQPVGRHVIYLCDSVSCFVMDSEKLQVELCETLNVAPGGTTEDGRFTLLPIVCLGACDRAPAMMIDDQMFGPVNADNLSEILARFE